jgi:hypothetical protein
MIIESAIVRALGVVDRALRKDFPEDFDKRCMYAASATCVLLHEAGFESTIVGGDFVAFVVSASGHRAGMQGFGGGKDQPSHYWVRVSDKIVDIGPHYLPWSSSFPAATLPFVAWSQASAPPKFLRYRPTVDYGRSVQRLATFDSVDRSEAFVNNCRRRFESQSGQPKLPAWLLTDWKSLKTAAEHGDFWARNAIRFSNETDESSLPF